MKNRRSNKANEKPPKSKKSAKRSSESILEKTGNFINEWILGNFSAREARQRQAQKSQDTRRAFNKDIEMHKHAIRDHTFKDILKEWFLGDFTKREAESKFEQREEYTQAKQEYLVEKKKLQKQERQQVIERRKSEFQSKISQNLNHDKERSRGR